SRRNVLPGTSILPRDARPTPVRPLTGTPTSRGSTPLSKKVKTDEFSGAVAGWTDPAVVTLAARLSAGSAAAMGAARRCQRDWLACGSVGALGTGWGYVAAVRALLRQTSVRWWLVPGVAYGFLPLSLHGPLMWFCVGRHHPPRGFGREFVSAWQRGH